MLKLCRDPLQRDKEGATHCFQMADARGCGSTSACAKRKTSDVSNIACFGDPVFSYSHRQRIRDGFLPPYKVVKVHIDRDVEDCRPEKGQLDRVGELVEDRI